MVSVRDPKLIVLLFNEMINSQDIQKLSELMADDYTFINTKNENHPGKQANIDGWTEFFSLYPDYRNVFQKISSVEKEVFVLGYSICSFDPLDGPAIWTAKVENNKIKEWRVYNDTDENRTKFNFKQKS